MSDPGVGPGPEPSAWTAPPVRHSYGLAARNHGLTTALVLLIRTMPYAFARFGILLAYSVACIVWMVVAFRCRDRDDIGGSSGAAAVWRLLRSRSRVGRAARAREGPGRYPGSEPDRRGCRTDEAVGEQDYG